MVLADAATVSDGKLNLLGAGWTVTGPQPTPMAIGLLVAIPWSEANRPHRLRISLVDSDGQLVNFIASDGSSHHIEVQADLEVGRPPGLLPGSPLPVPLAIPITPLPLEPGHRYVWQLHFDDRTHDDWRVVFDTRPDRMRLAG
jgi:hypothetical protein